MVYTDSQRDIVLAALASLEETLWEKHSTHHIKGMLAPLDWASQDSSAELHRLHLKMTAIQRGALTDRENLILAAALEDLVQTVNTREDLSGILHGTRLSATDLSSYQFALDVVNMSPDLTANALYRPRQAPAVSSPAHHAPVRSTEAISL
ncbi:hypothetical protein VRRI112168_03680 [Vreelandella rituensis]|uniref:Uncharacterized protein n=1 Tax=Vreelandella rituensis TaxID=2282306 RepID=A0A368UBK7_9GAMM|nr:hypothetical protein [Halomonas rituensis]RCV93752.1 hypothetical protein DU506_00945 [Halomonas rituensis]